VNVAEENVAVDIVVKTVEIDVPVSETVVEMNSVVVIAVPRFSSEQATLAVR